jgi:signal peptidase I
VRRAVTALVAVVLAAAAVAGAAAGQDERAPRLEVHRFPSPSMVPRFEIGDRLEFDLDAYAGDAEPARGDIVLYHAPKGSLSLDHQCGRPRHPGRRLCRLPRGGPVEERFVKRVVAVAGDRIRARRDGRFVVDGRRERRRIVRCSGDECRFRGRIRVPEGHVYVAGDNRPGSDDSRYWGALPVGDVLGRYTRTLPAEG